jgi:hypothetical protein
VSSLATLLVLAACGGAARRGDSDNQGAATAGSSASAGAGSHAGGGAAPQAGGNTVGGQTDQTEAGAAGDAPVSHFPGGSAEEEEIVAPLFADATAAADDFEALIELAAQVGIARGYAQCRCFRSPMAPPADVTELMACARDEAGGLGGLFLFPSLDREPILNRDLLQCLRDRGPSPELLRALRCEVEIHQKDGQAWFGWCLADQENSSFPVVQASCDSEAWDTARSACQSVVYCGDGAPVAGNRCNSYRDCPDGSDEQNCFEVKGNDAFVCGDGVVPDWALCTDECSVALVPPVCDRARPNVFLCADGGAIPTTSLCDRQRDCADGSDEASCAR